MYADPPTHDMGSRVRPAPWGNVCGVRTPGGRPLSWRRGWLGELALRRRRVPGLRTGKTVLAAVAAYVVASLVSVNPHPVLAPLTALLVVQLTLYETLTSGVRRVLSVVAGVLLALGFSDFVGFTWWSLGLLVLTSIGVGKLLRVGEQLMEVPISGMLVLAVGGAHTTASSRVYETLIGAGVGVAVGALVAPPLYVQPAGDALLELADRMVAVLHRAAGELRAGWSHEQAKRWLDDARRVGQDVARAHRAFSRAEQGMRLNPRAHRVGATAPSLRAALAALEYAATALRGVCRALADRTELAPEESPYDDAARATLADLLDDVGSAVTAFAALAARDVLAATGDDRDLREALGRARERQDAVGAVLAVDPLADRPGWRLHGALMTDLDRMLREVDLVAGPSAAGVPRGGPAPRRRADVAVRDTARAARAAGQLRRRRSHPEP